MNTKIPGPQVHEIDWLTSPTRESLLLAQKEVRLLWHSHSKCQRSKVLY